MTVADDLRGLAECWSNDPTDEVKAELLAGAAELDRLSTVIAAARAWRAALIPSTSTATWPPTRDLAAAVDRLDCPHPRAHRIYHVTGERECARCGAQLPAEAST